MKVVGFAQLRNELSKGGERGHTNLENWFKIMSQICETVYIFDQASDDSSIDYYYLPWREGAKARVIQSPTNRFNEELLCKAELLKWLLKNDGDADWILWLDGDTLLDGRLLRHGAKEFWDLCHRGLEESIDGFRMGHYNLWRSDNYYRVDSQYHDFHRRGRVPLWRNNGNLYFPETAGLHRRQQVQGLEKIERVDYSLVHRGFATDEQLIERYNLYKGLGQSGWSLDRLLDEDGLTVEELPDGLLPDWFEITDDQNPTGKPPLLEQRS